MPGPAIPPRRRLARKATGQRAGAGLAASAAAHLLLALLLLARLAVPPAAPDIPAEVELVLGGGGDTPGDPAPAPQPPPASPAAPATPAANAAPPPPSPADDTIPAPPAPAAIPGAPGADAAADKAPVPPPPEVRVGDAFAGLAARLVDDGAGRFRAAQADDGNLPPRYPRAAGRRQGSVTLRMHVGTDGRVGRVELLRSSGTEALDRSAADALGRWRFTPALRDGAPAADAVDMTINFRLD